MLKCNSSNVASNLSNQISNSSSIQKTYLTDKNNIKTMNSNEFLESKNIKDHVLNRDDLPEFWITISQLLNEFKELSQNDVVDSENNFIKKGEVFLSKHIHKIKDFSVKQGDKIEIICVYEKTADIKINEKLVTDVKFDDIGEIKYLLYKDY